MQHPLTQTPTPPQHMSQHLANPLFEKAKDIVSWMGAVQAQDYSMCKWAMGVRLKSAIISDMEKMTVKRYAAAPTAGILCEMRAKFGLKFASLTY